MTKFMFVGGSLTFKPPLKKLDEYIAFDQHQMIMYFPYNWFPSKINEKLLECAFILKNNHINLSGFLLVIRKDPHDRLELFKYIPLKKTLRAIPGYFHLVRTYSRYPAYYSHPIGPSPKPPSPKSSPKSSQYDDDDFSLPPPRSLSPPPKSSSKSSQKSSKQSSKKSSQHYYSDDFESSSSSQNSMPSHQNSQKSQNSKIQYPLHKNIILDDKSMNSLELKTWLEDEVVGSYFLHLHNQLIRQNGGFSDMIVLTHIFNENIRSMKGKITKAKLQEYCLQLKNEPINKYYNYILLPIILHDNKKIGVSNGNHYFGVLIDFQNRDFIIYDSFTSHSHKKDIPFIHKILQILGLENDDKPFGHSVIHKPRQTNPLDCGVFVFFWARALMFFDSDESREFLSKDTLSKTELNQMREHIRQELEQYHRKDKKPSPVHSSDVELLESPKTSPKTSQKLSQKLSESSSSFPSSIPLSSTLSSLSPSESPKSSQKSQIHKNITITDSDVNSLQQNKKLTDNTVYSYIQHLENEAQKIKRKENILILTQLTSINPSLLKKSKLLFKDLKSIDPRLAKKKRSQKRLHIYSLSHGG